MSNPQSCVLVAEDDARMLRLMQRNLELANYRVLTAQDGLAALEQVETKPCDLILLDIMMPKISGFEVCKRLRADPGTRDIAVLMITGLDQPSDMDKAVDAGTDDFVTKPIKKPELLQRVKAMLEAKKNKRELERTLAYINALEKGGP